MQLTYDEVRQMYSQNPRPGFYFLELIAERLMRDARRAAQGRGPIPGDVVGRPSAA